MRALFVKRLDAVLDAATKVLKSFAGAMVDKDVAVDGHCL